MTDGDRRTARWLGSLFGLIALGSVSVAVILPAVALGLGVSASDGAWLISVYILMLAVGTPVYGRLADLYGIRRPLLAGVSLMSAGALLCACAPSFPVAVIGRVVQGCGAAAVPPLVMALVDVLYDGTRRSVALGTVTGVSSAVACLGPLLGGGVEELLGWRVALGLPVLGLLALVPLWPLLPTHGSGARLDVLGATLVTAAAGGVVLVLQSPAASWPAERVGVPLLLLSVPGLVAVVRRRPDGFLPRRVLGRGPVFASLAAAAVTAVWFGLLVSVPVILASEGWEPWHVGLAMAPAALSGYAAARLAGAVLSSWGPPICLAFADAGCAVAALLVAGGAVTDHPVWSAVLVVLGLMLAMSVAGLGLSALVAEVSSWVEPDVRGVAIGLATLVFLTGGAGGAALLGGFGELVGTAACLVALAAVALVAVPVAQSLRPLPGTWRGPNVLG